MFEAAQPKSTKLAACYEELAELYNCHYLNCSEHIESSDKDGIHLEAAKLFLKGARYRPVPEPPTRKVLTSRLESASMP